MIDQLNYDLLDTFYGAFSRRDHSTMRALYHPDATFEDAAFALTGGARIADMWEMLCVRGEDLELEYRILSADHRRGRVHWEARYSFGPRKRPVHNVLEAHLEIRDGLIVKHRDEMDFRRWSKQALGLPGMLFGWSDTFHRKVRQTAHSQLARYVARRDAKR